MEVVGTGLCDGVDGSAVESALADIVGSDADAHLFDGIERDRGAAAGEDVASQTEGIVELCTVDGDVALTVVTSTHGIASGSGATLGRLDEHGGEVAAGGGHEAHAFGVDGGDGAGAAHAHVTASASGYDDSLVKVVAAHFHRCFDGEWRAELEHDVLVGLALVADVGDGDVVGTTGAQTVEVETTVVVRHAAVAGSRGSVYSNDVCTDDGFAVLVGDASYDA